MTNTITISYRKLDGTISSREIAPIESRVAKLTKYTEAGRPTNRRYLRAIEVATGIEKSFYYDSILAA